jgi:hypothetical protein
MTSPGGNRSTCTYRQILHIRHFRQSGVTAMGQTEVVMDPTLAVNIVQAGESLPGVYGAFSDIRKGTKSRPGAEAVYLTHQAAVSTALANLSTIVSIGVPPPASGAVWSWPVVYRAHGSLAESVTQMAVSFGSMVMIGDYDVVEAAHSLGLAFVECTTALPRVGRRIAMTKEYQQKLDEAQFALRAFLLAARKDLNVPGRTELSRPDAAPTKDRRRWGRRR